MAPSADLEISSIPSGDYKVVAIALDLTGRKLVDEICHIGAYENEERNFSQYVMPFHNVRPFSVKSHGIRVVTTFGRYRVLKDARTMRTLKTKSEYATICDFMEWMKETKGESDGIIVAYHDNDRETIPSYLLDALTRYKLVDDFFKMVPGFVNVAHFAKEIADEEGSDLKGSVTLRALSKKLLDNEQVKGKTNKMISFQSAKIRSRITYLVLQKLMKTESEVPVNPDLLKCVINRQQASKTLENQKQEEEERRVARKEARMLEEQQKSDKTKKERESSEDRKESSSKETSDTDSSEEVSKSLEE